MSKNYTRLVDCYYFEQDFESLERLMMRLPDHTPVLRLIADRFSSIGMCYEASLALIKLSDIESAIHLCINNHRWSTAIQIAEKYKYADLDNLLHKYAEHLVSKGKILESVELFRKSNYPQKAAQWLLQIVQDLKESKTNREIVKSEPGLLKQLYVLAGLEVERWRLQNRQVKGFVRITYIFHLSLFLPKMMM
jgi:WD repeat-containing protein 35